jgi:outer membrane protein
MKKTIITMAIALIATFFGASQSIAQNKFAYIDFQELMQLMPEYKKATSDMEAFSKTLQDELKKMSEEFEKKYTDYQKQQATMSEAIRGLREKELRDMQSRIQDFQETAQDDARKKEQDLLKPIIEKAKATIAQVAKEGNYTYVFDSSPGTPLLYKPDGDNIMAAVKKKLGIL